MAEVFYHSAEIRWFLTGDHLGSLISWFTRNDKLALITETDDYDREPGSAPFIKLERPRTDEYLMLPACETVGVKQRQGRLEIKSLVAGPRPFELNGLRGRVDQWVKWSLKPSGKIVQTLESDLHMSGPWVTVGKTRYTQKYSYDNGSMAAISPDAWPAAGCNIELTVLDMQAETGKWTTVGFEAFGNPAKISGMLEEAASHFFDNHGSPPVKFDGRDSLSYPSWLALNF
jgi:hypothetical protein